MLSIFLAFSLPILRNEKRDMSRTNARVFDCPASIRVMKLLDSG